MTVTWADVARKDVEDALRSRLLWALTAIFVAFLAMSLPVAQQLFPEATTVDAAKALSGVAMLTQLFVPGIALVAGYMALVGERRTGSLRVLMSFPFSRGDVMAGKLLGRSVVTATALLVGFGVASVLVVALYGAPESAPLVGFVAASLLLGLAFTGLAVGGSAAAASRGRAMALTVGTFVASVFFWKPVAAGSYYAITGSLPGLEAAEWYFVLKRLNPLEAYRVLVSEALGTAVSAVPQFPVEDLPAGVSAAQVDLATRLGGDVPVYLETRFSIVVLLAWGAVPVALGYWWFQRSDLG